MIPRIEVTSMKIKKWMSWLALALCGALLVGCDKPEPEMEPSSETTVSTTPTEPVAVGPDGYRDAAAYGDGFLAVGTQGRIDYISSDGAVENRDSGTTATLSGIYVDDGYVMISAEDGTVVCSQDGVTYSINPVGTERLLGITVFDNQAYAVSDQGTIYTSLDLVEWNEIRIPDVDSATGIASDDSCVVVISEDTDIVTSTDGQNWAHQNYNEKYQGLSNTYGFRRAAGAGGTFFILGYYLDNPNMPAVLYSEDGEVIMEKALMEINGETPTGDSPIVLNDLGVDVDQLYAPCDDGSVLTITSCAVCNEMQQIAGAPRLTCIALTEQSVLVAGDDFYYSILDGDVLRQDRIKAEQARYDVENNGAILVDVREDSELEESGYIPGSLHIPLAEVETKLPELVPNTDTELIFYCAVGKRAQKGAEIANELGYYMVYNLGGLSDWPYEIVEGTNSGGGE